MASTPLATLCAALLLGSTAQAATLHMVYVGNYLGYQGYPELPTYGPGYKVDLSISEEALGRSLAGSSVDYFVDIDPNPLEYSTGLTIGPNSVLGHGFLPQIGGSTLSFAFDNDYNLLRYNIKSTPEGVASENFMAVVDTGGDYYRAYYGSLTSIGQLYALPGVWTITMIGDPYPPVATVPLPASALLLAGALSALGIARRRRV